MHKKIPITIFLLFGFSISFSQSAKDIVFKYIEAFNDTSNYELNHSPINYTLKSCGNIQIFFVNSANGENYNFGVVYNSELKDFQRFGENRIDPTLSPGVTSVFFENVDDDPQKEMIVLYENHCRTYFSPMGGYAGIKVYYQTRVFTFECLDGELNIKEYKAIGELLTVNQPLVVGTYEEETLILREDYELLNDILEVTYNSDMIKKRIKMLKGKGLLGGNN